MLYLDAIFKNWPVGLSRLMRLQPFFTMTTGLLVIFLFRKGFEYVPLAIVLVILAFVIITFRIYRLREDEGVIASFGDMALIFLLNNMLYFVIPFYFESMTFPSRNVLFAPVIIGLAVIAGWFSLYQRLIARHPLRSSLFYALTFFCVLNLLFPILLAIRNIWSILISGGIAAATVVLFVYPHTDMLKDRKNTVIFVLGVTLIFTLLWFGRSLIPPSPLKLTRTTACREVIDYRPVEPFARARTDTITDVCFYSSIFAPRGLSEKINHIWYHDGRRLLTIPLSEIRGGRKVGFGTWSCRTILEGKGLYTVEVWTAGGQLLGQGSFVIY
ncbi:MAG: DUF2914 domain-containing protein [Spirochaetes bacterium]|nr:DUF2914 domain-containing protein [Spirochaetota bacterium]